MKVGGVRSPHRKDHERTTTEAGAKAGRPRAASQHLCRSEAARRVLIRALLREIRAEWGRDRAEPTCARVSDARRA